MELHRQRATKKAKSATKTEVGRPAEAPALSPPGAADAARPVAGDAAEALAPLARLVLPLLARFGVTVWPHYGQTELGGTVMIGGVEGDLTSMRLFPGLRYELVDADGTLQVPRRRSIYPASVGAI